MRHGKTLFLIALSGLALSLIMGTKPVEAAVTCENLEYSVTGAVNGRRTLTLPDKKTVALAKLSSGESYVGNDGEGTSYKIEGSTLSKQGGAEGSTRSHTYLAICDFSTINAMNPVGTSGASANSGGSGSGGSAATSNNSLTYDEFKFTASGFKSMFCSEKIVNGKAEKRCESYEEWISAVWNFAAVIAIPIGTIMLMAAGILYAYSGGDPKKTETAKKLMTGVASGIAILVLSKMIIFTILELDGAWNLSMVLRKYI